MALFFPVFRGYDELIHCEKSSHDRLLLEACYAYRLELIMQPIVDEHVGLLWVSIRYQSPSLIRLLPSPEKIRSLRFRRVEFAMLAKIAISPEGRIRRYS